MQVNVDLATNMGRMANSILNNKGDLNIGAMRPFIDTDGTPCITCYKGSGDPKLADNWVTSPINTNALLRRDEWKQLDDVLVEVGRTRLGGVQDLIDNGLVYNLNNAMGTTVLEWHDVSGEMEAIVSMDAVTRGKNNRPVFGHNYLPIPIIHADYEILTRELATSRNMGNGIDTLDAAAAARAVLQKLENMLFTNDGDYAFGELDSRSRNKIYSYITYPDRNQVELTVDWTESGKTPAQILADIVAMKSAASAKFKYGPYMLYIPTAYEVVLDEDYNISGQSLMTTRERIMKIANIKAIKVVDTLPANNVLLVQMTSDVVRLVRGLALQNVEWKSEGGMITNYKVMTIQVPQLRSDANGASGVVHLA